MTFPNDPDRPKFVYDDGRSSFVGISIGALFVLALIIGALVWNAGSNPNVASNDHGPATMSPPATSLSPPVPSNPATVPTAPRPSTQPNG